MLWKKTNPFFKEGDEGKDKDPVILCTVKAMTQKTACVDSQFHLETVNLWWNEKGFVNYLVEEMMLFK